MPYTHVGGDCHHGRGHPPRSPLDGFAGIVATTLGLFCTAIGGLLYLESELTGLWIVAIGVNLLVTVIVGTTAGRQRLGLPPDGTRMTVGFVMVAVILAVAFIVVNVAIAMPRTA